MSRSQYETEISLPHLFKACRTRASCHSTQFHAACGSGNLLEVLGGALRVSHFPFSEVFQGSARKMGCSGSKAATKKAELGKPIIMHDVTCEEVETFKDPMSCSGERR